MLHIGAFHGGRHTQHFFQMQLFFATSQKHTKKNIPPMPWTDKDSEFHLISKQQQQHPRISLNKYATLICSDVLMSSATWRRSVTSLCQSRPMMSKRVFINTGCSPSVAAPAGTFRRSDTNTNTRARTVATHIFASFIACEAGPGRQVR